MKKLIVKLGFFDMEIFVVCSSKLEIYNLNHYCFHVLSNGLLILDQSLPIIFVHASPW